MRSKVTRRLESVSEGFSNRGGAEERVKWIVVRAARVGIDERRHIEFGRLGGGELSRSAFLRQ